MKTVREQLLLTMFDALYTQGYSASNLNDILQKAGTSKGGMYHHFRSKKELALLAIEEVIGDFIFKVWEQPLKESENPLQTLFDTLLSLSDQYYLKDYPMNFHFGCPINNMIQELSALDQEFSELLKDLFTRWEESIVQALMRVKKQLRIDVNIKHAAAFIIASIEGSFSYAKVYDSKKEFNQLMLQLVEFIKSLVRY